MSQTSSSTVPLHVVLVHPEIPQNTGNIGRTCVAVGAKLWLVRPLGFRLDEHHMRRAGLDYWEHLEWEVVDTWDELLTVLPTDRLWFFSRRGRRDYSTAHYTRGDALVLGSESTGLPRSLYKPEHENVLRIPMREQARSLNLATSVAIVAYEALRQFAADQP